MKTLSTLVLAGLLATPLAAQVAPPAPPAAPGVEAPRVKVMRMHRGQMFPNVSPEGRAILRETMRRDPAEREQLRAARDRINGLVAADRLDVAALRRAMEEERRLVDANHARRQAGMLAAIQKLSPADRKAFAEDAQRGRADVEARTAEWRRWADQFRERMKDMPLPPTPPGLPGDGVE